MVDIVDGSLRVNQLDQILDNLNDILLGQYANIHIGVQTKLFVDTVTTNITQIITLVREEQVLDNLTCAGIISRVSITQLTVDVKHSLLLRVRWVFGQCIEDDAVVLSNRLVLVHKDSLCATLKDFHHVLLGNLSLTLHNHLVTLD